MTRAQQIHYRAVLWPAACEAQGWDTLSVADRESKRRAVTLEASGGRTDSTSELDSRWGCTRLFLILKQLAAPLDLDAARAVANPEESEEADERKRLIYSISQTGFNDVYIAKVAVGYCREHRVGIWQRLPLSKLTLIRVTLEARRHAQNKKQKTGPVPISENHFEYQLKPRPQTKLVTTR